MGGKVTSAQVRASEGKKKAAGLREIRVWVPDRERFGPEAENKIRALAAELAAEIEEQGK
jgi:ribosomal protein S11